MPAQAESDHISEREVQLAFTQGWDDYPQKPQSDNPFKRTHKLLEDAWSQGWEDARYNKGL
jgi:hypothetical protein